MPLFVFPIAIGPIFNTIAATLSLPEQVVPTDITDSTCRPPEPHPNWIQEEFRKGSCGVQARRGTE